MTVAEDVAEDLREAARLIEYHKDQRDTLIRMAMDEGASAREVAELAGMSHTWVLRIWRDQRGE